MTNTMHVQTFCGLLGWLVIAHSACIGCFDRCLSLDIRRADSSTCLITQQDGSEICAAVHTDDGQVYNGHALRTWLQRCRRSGRPMCVIPGRPIGIVKAAWQWPTRQTSVSKPSGQSRATRPSVTSVTSVATQTDTHASEVPSDDTTVRATISGHTGSVAPRQPRRRSSCFTIPSKHSAFVAWRRT